MAYLYRRKNGRVEVREAHSTPRGPRSRTLASFQVALTRECLDRAEAASTRPFDRVALCARARELEIPVERPGAHAAARVLIAQLRRGAALEPVLARVLREQLASIETEPVPSALVDVVDWIGASDHERGSALRDVLRLYDTIARSREPVRNAEAPRFPRFEVQAGKRAS